MKNQPKIVIVGAGPSGIFSAHYLRKRGYDDVTVLEKLGHVGGLCRTMTVNGRSFDLGANYVTPAYTEVLKVAKEVGAELYAERPMVAMSLPDDKDEILDEPSDGFTPLEMISYQSMFKAVREKPEGGYYGILPFTWALVRYTWRRWCLRHVIDKPTFAGVAKYKGDNLYQPFLSWLESHNLGMLERVFQLPVTLMGYGDMTHTPAIYPLKFMTVASFVPMVAKETPFIGRFVRWPKRFVLGYQRMFQRLSWNLDVRLDIKIKKIERSDDGVEIVYEQLNTDLNTVVGEQHTLKADHLILACPLNGDNVADFGLSEEEREFFSKIDITSYCMTTLHAQGITASLAGTSPLAAVYPPPKLGSDWPYGIAKQWTDNNLVQVYTRTKSTDPTADVEPRVFNKAKKTIELMGGTIDPNEQTTFDRWTYFQHVDSEEIENGWYDELEARQGSKRTWFVGGATNFELIEPIAEYAKNLVASNFPIIPKAGGWPRHIWRYALIAAVLLPLGYCATVPAPTQLTMPMPYAKGEARDVSVEYWKELHAGNWEALREEACRLQVPGTPPGEGQPLYCRMLMAVKKQPDDLHLPTMVASATMWRMQQRLSNQFLTDSLATAQMQASAGAKVGNKIAPGFEAALLMMRGYHNDDAEQKRAGYDMLVANTKRFPAFHGFVEGTHVSALLHPDQEDPWYGWTMISFMETLESCLIGHYVGKPFELPEGMRVNNFLYNTVYFVAKLTGRNYCYNTNVAPFNMQGMFIAQGDAYLKHGKIDYAIAAYQNALGTPNTENWPYADAVRYRLSHLEDVRKKFVADSGKLAASDYPVAMIAQSKKYCATCHARQDPDAEAVPSLPGN